MNGWAVLAAILGMASMAAGDDFKCWNCQGNTFITSTERDKDPWCVDGNDLYELGSLKHYAMKTCESKKCLRNYQFHPGGGAHHKHVITRKCAPLESVVGCTYSKKLQGNFESGDCVCESSLCNSATTEYFLGVNILSGTIIIFGVMSFA